MQPGGDSYAKPQTVLLPVTGVADKPCLRGLPLQVGAALPCQLHCPHRGPPADIDLVSTC